MKKIFLINLAACTVLCLALVMSTRNEKSICSIQCSSDKKDVKQKENKIQGGAGADDQFFQFNRIYIKI